MKNSMQIGLWLAVSVFAFSQEVQRLPDLKMPESGLEFREIQRYDSYHIVATHFRKDKNELRYILANDIAFEAIKAERIPLPNGSKIVKIGWSVKDMARFPDALEADNIQRVEYMIRTEQSHRESDGWGYARFVKKDGEYTPYTGDIQSCVACHALMHDHDALFTRYQKHY
jgi:hypothetical protein